MTYQLLIKPSARKELEQLNDSILRRIDEAIGKLSTHPRPVGSKKLVGLHSIEFVSASREWSTRSTTIERP